MTYKEKVAIMSPGCVDENFIGGVIDCPSCYGFPDDPNCDCKSKGGDETKCTKCWNREIGSTETIRIKYHSDAIDKLTYIAGKSDWIDLRAAEEVELKAGEFKLISLGIGMQLPAGYEAVVVPRSSTFKNFGIIQTNHMGVIDETYCGDNDVWKFPAYAMRDTVIHVNDRICQFRIQKHQPQITFEEVDVLGNADRGGIGSTGKQ